MIFCSQQWGQSHKHILTKKKTIMNCYGSLPPLYLSSIIIINIWRAWSSLFLTTTNNISYLHWLYIFSSSSFFYHSPHACCGCPTWNYFCSSNFLDLFSIHFSIYVGLWPNRWRKKNNKRKNFLSYLDIYRRRKKKSYRKVSHTLWEKLLFLINKYKWTREANRTIFF